VIERRHFQWPWTTPIPYGRRTKPHPSFWMIPDSMTFSDLFKVTIIQRQIYVNSTSPQRQLPIAGVLAFHCVKLPMTYGWNASAKMHFSDAFHQYIGRTGAFHPSPLPTRELWWLACRLPALETPCLGCRLPAHETVSRAGYRHPRRGVSSAGSHGRAKTSLQRPQAPANLIKGKSMRALCCASAGCVKHASHCLLVQSL